VTAALGGVRRAWFALEPYILQERKLRSPTYLAYFEHLVCMIAEADLAEIHRGLNLRKIGTRSDRFRREFQRTPDSTPVAGGAPPARRPAGSAPEPAPQEAD
jgi:hypothetical protein